MQLSLAALLLLASAPAFADNDKACDYNEFHGMVVRDYEAQDGVRARGWAPRSATLCQAGDKTRYVILGYQAVGLGLLRDVPLTALEPGQVPSGEKHYTALVGTYDEGEAFELLKNPQIENVLLFGDSKTQILAYRKQLGRILSNTLFLKE